MQLVRVGLETLGLTGPVDCPHAWAGDPFPLRLCPGCFRSSICLWCCELPASQFCRWLQLLQFQPSTCSANTSKRWWQSAEGPRQTNCLAPAACRPAYRSAEGHGHGHARGEGHVWAPGGPGRQVWSRRWGCGVAFSRPAQMDAGAGCLWVTSCNTSRLRPLQVLGCPDAALAAELQDWRPQ